MSHPTLPAHYQPDFEQTWMHRLQRRESKLINFVRRAPVNGYRKRFSQLEKGEMREITTRAGATTQDLTESYIRWLATKKYERTDLLDEWDANELGELIAPTGDYTEAHVYAYNRQIDATIRDAIQGNALTGEAGTTETPLGAGQTVEEDYVASGSAVNSGLTFAKVARTKKIFEDNDVPMGNRFFAISPDDEQDLIRDVIEIKSSDYTKVQPITDGTVQNKTWMGFYWILTTGLTTASNVTNCLAWHRDYIVFGDGQKRANIDILPDQSHAVQVRTRGRMGGTRLEEKGAVVCQTYHA